MEDLIANGICNHARNVDNILKNAESGENYHEPVEENDEANGDEYASENCGTNNDRNIWCRTLLTPLDMNVLTNRALSRTTHI